MIDLFSRYTVAVPLPDQTAMTVVNAVLNFWFHVFGSPRGILTDRGTNFESAIFANLCNVWRVCKCRTTSYHPEGNGCCEKMNQNIKKGLQKLLNNQNFENWDSVLSQVLFAYNSPIHSATGFTPYFLMFGS